MLLTVYDTCMDNHNHTRPSRDDTDQHVSNPPATLVSEMLPAFLDYLRVEEHRTRTTLIRYESHIQKFITTVGDCSITQIGSETLSIYKRRLLDESLAPATIRLTGSDGDRRTMMNVRRVIPKNVGIA